MKTAVIALESIYVQRRGTVILRDISFALEPGSFMAVLGPNGAGKTTLLNTIAGFTGCSGKLNVLGADIGRLSSAARNRLRRRIGYVPQLHTRTVSGIPFSVKEVVAMGRAGITGPGRSPTADDRRRCREAMRQTGLEAIADRPFSVLSGGEQRKVHLARTLAQEPALLLLDEPAGHLDLRWREAITHLISRLWRSLRLTIVMITHDPCYLPAEVTHAAIIKQGRLLRIGPLADVMDAELLTHVYGVPLQLLQNNGRNVLLPKTNYP